ncbi:hypothetical protein GCM10027048_12310 [Hymenobacter coalescens]
MSLYAYNPDWPHHEAVHAAATRWHRRGLLSAQQLAEIQAAHPLDFYRPPVFVRIGLFLFTTLGALAGVGLVGTMFGFNFLGTLIISLLIGGVMLETTIRNKRLYHSGADNALLYLELLGLIVLIGYVVFEAWAPAGTSGSDFGSARLLLVLLPAVGVLLLATLRYTDRLVAATALLAVLLTLANTTLLLPFGPLVLPFVLLLASAGTYAAVVRLLQQPRQFYYRRCLIVLKALALGTAYLAVNYLVVREGNAALLGTGTSGQIPLAPLFYLTTAGIPVLYLVQGLRRPDRIWLWLGLLTAAFSVYTLRHYRSLLPLETAAVLVGTALIAFAVWATRYLRHGRHGLTSAADEATPQHLNLESLIVAQTAHAAPTAATPAGVEFGGGHSGGGGATGSY